VSGRAQRGFTLLELMIALLVSMVVVAAALALMTAQVRIYRGGNDERQIQESGRIAIEEITANLRTAGFGIDPVVAFDFGPIADAGVTQAPTGTVAPTENFQCQTGQVTCRDKIDGPDEIVFRARDPAFGHRFTRAISGDVITVNGPLRADLNAGQILQVVCYTSPMTWAYVTVGATVPKDPPTTEVSITLKAGKGTVTSASFPLQNILIQSGACFSAVAPDPATANVIAGATKVFKVDTYRYFVKSYAGRPFLMLDQGFDPPAEPTVVAPDVEDLQFAYVFPNAPATTQRVGDTVGVPIAMSDGPNDIDLAPADGLVTYNTAGDSPARLTHHPANIRLVRVSAVVRAPFPADRGAFDTMPAAGNRPMLTHQPLYRRFLIESSAPTRNLDGRAPYFPSWSAGLAPITKIPLDTLNQGGG
jgi:type IV pilus assembly protein PilW